MTSIKILKKIKEIIFGLKYFILDVMLFQKLTLLVYTRILQGPEGALQDRERGRFPARTSADQRPHRRSVARKVRRTAVPRGQAWASLWPPVSHPGHRTPAA